MCAEKGVQREITCLVIITSPGKSCSPDETRIPTQECLQSLVGRSLSTDLPHCVVQTTVNDTFIVVVENHLSRHSCLFIGQSQGIRNFTHFTTPHFHYTTSPTIDTVLLIVGLFLHVLSLCFYYVSLLVLIPWGGVVTNCRLSFTEDDTKCAVPSTCPQKYEYFLPTMNTLLITVGMTLRSMKPFE